VSYELVLALRKGETFDGQVTITFEVYDEDYDERALFVDYHGLGVKDLVLNEVPLNSEDVFDGQRIYLDRKLLTPGTFNFLRVTFRSKYRNDGTGCHHFADPEDGNEYLYTQFEAFNCHRTFPCFDQPDLRAALSLRVLSPKDWVVVANGLEQGVNTTGDAEFDSLMTGVHPDLYKPYIDGFYIQKFNDTPDIAPYLYAFIAGPYDCIERSAEIPGRAEPLKMRLFYRKTLKADVERVQDLMFDPAIKGIHWYSKFFGFNYPFEKYDQIFCPEFKFGAMENVAAVTFSENLLFRGKDLSEKDTTTLVNVVLHELCHHWFGDLVTMQWWNDLWLNESFATYVSFLCMACEESLFEQSPNLWVNVNSYKNWGYAEDDLVTGHPICKQAPHTDSADDMINGITYGKGCSFLKQLFHLIGYDTFSKATQLYFAKYQWKNTVLRDFLGCLDEANELLPQNTPGLVVSKWAETFLNTRGANVFSAKFSGDQLVITQEVPEFSDGLRQQKLDIMLFDENFNEDILTVLTSEENPVTKIKVSDPEKRYFILNHGDHAYGKIILSAETSDFLSRNLSGLKDSLTRALVWKGIQGMVKTCRIKSTVYFEYVQNNIPEEDQQMLIETVLTTASMLLEAYVPDKEYESVCADMFTMTYKMLCDQKRSNIRAVIANTLFKFLKTQKHVEMAISWLEAGSIRDENDNNIPGCELSKNQKFSIVQAAHTKLAIPAVKKQELLEKVTEGDKSDIAANLRLSCKALLPDKASKEEVWRQISDHKLKLSSYERRALMTSFFNRDSAEIVMPYYEKYVATVRDCATCGNKNFADAFIVEACPSFNITDAFIASLKQVVAEFSGDVKHESYCRNVNKVIGSLEINKKIKDFASE
jgi:aminopeptidase N